MWSSADKGAGLQELSAHFLRFSPSSTTSAPSSLRAGRLRVVVGKPWPAADESSALAACELLPQANFSLSQPQFAHLQKEEVRPTAGGVMLMRTCGKQHSLWPLFYAQ